MAALATPTTEAILTTEIVVQQEHAGDFAKWQAKLHRAISEFPGFVSLEIISRSAVKEVRWAIVQRFQESASLVAWQQGETRTQLFDEIRNWGSFRDEMGGTEGFSNEITEIFVTQVSPEQEKAYRDWIAKIHQAEAEFPGFKGVYVQAPKQNGGRNWITFLQFDRQENLDRWLNSEKRAALLQEAAPLIASLESHRVISPYAGWFAKVYSDGQAPSVLKQSMLVLLVLFPIVMLELRYLPLMTGQLNGSPSTFIGNAISVGLISWPFMPIALYFLGWWLELKKQKQLWWNLFGFLILIALYAIEILVFWK